MKLIDISSDMLTASVYPGDPIPQTQKIHSLALGDAYDLTFLSTGLHAGTHIDAPSHYVQGGKNINEVPLQTFIGECLVYPVNGIVTGSMVDEMELYGCERLLLKGNGRSVLMESAAMELAQQSGLKLIGIDHITIALPSDETNVHRAFLTNGISILEGLVLSEASAGKHFLFAPPLKLKGCEAAPARAVLIEDYLYWNK